MNKYLSSSLISNLANGLYHNFVSSYTYKVLRFFNNCYKHSKLNQLIMNYLLRASTLKHSATYRICSKVFSSVDRLWDWLYAFGVKIGKTSYVLAFIKKTFYTTSSSIAYSLFILCFSCGYGVTSILLGSFNNIKAILLVLGLLISILFLVEKPRWIACLRGSLFWRIALYLFE